MYSLRKCALIAAIATILFCIDILPDASLAAMSPSTLKLERVPGAAGGEVRILLRYTNLSSDVVRFPGGAWDIRWGGSCLTVTDASGKKVEPVNRVLPENFAPSGTRHYQFLEPGETAERAIILSKWYDMTNSESYDIVAECNGAKSGKVRVEIMSRDRVAN